MNNVNFKFTDGAIQASFESETFQYVYLSIKNYFSNLVTTDDKITIIDFDYNNSKSVKTFSNMLDVLQKNEYRIKLDKNLQDLIDKLTDEEASLQKMKDQVKQLKKLEVIPEIGEFKSKASENLTINLRNYQLKASYFLSLIKSGFDFSVPGSGKTIISYTFYNYLLNQGNVEYLFVVGPKSASNAWFEEYQTCFGSKPNLEDLSNRQSSFVKSYLLSSLKNHKEITFINFDKFRLLENEIREYFKDKKILLIIDEAHKVKNPDAKVTKTAMNLSSLATHRLLLTGTPMPNGFEDLYSLCKIAFPSVDILPYSYGELKTFSKTGISKEKETNLIESIKSFYSRVSKKYLLNIGELKEPFFYYSKIQMSDKQKEIYEFLNNVFDNLKNKVDQTLKIILMKAILIRKMQASSNPVLLKKPLVDSFDEIASQFLPDIDNDEEIDPDKLEKMKNQLEVVEKFINNELKNSTVSGLINLFNDYRLVNKNIKAVSLAKSLVLEKKKVVLWDTFVVNMQALKSLLDDLGVESQIVNGQVTGEDRKNIINSFRNGSLQVLIASPATLAESISLHRACQNSIYVNRNFNAAQFIQSKDRIHRINMPEGTTANYFFLENDSTIDSDIGKSLEIKEQRMLKILDSDEVVVKGDLNSVDLSGLTNEEIISYFTRR
jgi:SNF2 family DNA or RNA helicase